MSRKLVLGVVLLAGFGLVAGCEEAKKTSPQSGKETGDKIKDLGDKAKAVAEKAGEKVKDVGEKASEKAKDVGEKAKDAAEKAMKEGKEAALKTINDTLPKLEDKIKSLSGDKLKEATSKLEGLKKLIEDFKNSDAASWETTKEKLMKAYDELKKLVGA